MKKFFQFALLGAVALTGAVFTACSSDDDLANVNPTFDGQAVKTSFTYPGAIQYFGPAEVCDLTTRTLALEKGQD